MQGNKSAPGIPRPEQHGDHRAVPKPAWWHKIALEKEGVKSQFFTDKESTFWSDAVKLITVHSIKGLEFGVVFIIDLNDKVLPYPVISSDLLPKRKISDSGELFQDLIDIPIQPTWTKHAIF
jgi:hypothetical protein